ncbi:acyl-CoA thioester hydrolase, YbgC/YbaW family [Saccharomonospora marina XMU15]|uniref:Acyl-CoA thioester hydrolase, YbgC/YbaW family n=1 Tax=Saccharomonospora marina XMU15 TaxID=882083 RepID=H5X3M9_9PSEU|nr:thioesterase family protein [Saccharomonospora marina]EHR51042.1 acyl-CoA thioester hydrolase, YbgC/YbaW family [Saccharomonospora marina XMU15]
MPKQQREPVVRMPVKVRYHECDQQGIVFNAHYLAYVDMASFEFCKVLFGSHTNLIEQGIDMVVAESNLRYLRPCRFEDELVVALTVDHVGNTSMVLGVRIERGDELVVEGSNRYVWVGTADHRPTVPAEQVRKALLAAQGER